MGKGKIVPLGQMGSQSAPNVYENSINTRDIGVTFLAFFSIITIGHIITGYFANRSLNSPIVVTVCEIVFALVFLAASRAKLAKRQSRCEQKSDPILRGFVFEISPIDAYIQNLSYALVIGYIGFVTVSNYSTAYLKATDTTYTPEQIDKLKTINEKFITDSAKTIREYEDGMTQIQENVRQHIEREKSKLQSELKEINSSIAYAQKIGAKTDTWINKKRVVERKMESIPLPPQYETQRNKLNTHKIIRIEEIKSKKQSEIALIDNTRKAFVQNNVRNINTNQFLTDAFLILVVLIQHTLYYKLYAFCASNGIKLSLGTFIQLVKSVKQKPVSINDKLDKKEFEHILKSIAVGSETVSPEKLKSWYRHKSPKYQYVINELNKKGIVVQFSKSGYPKGLKRG